MNKDPELVRMPYKKFMALQDTAREIRKQIDTGKGKIRDLFTEVDNYPSVEDLKSHHVAENIRKYLPYLVFYITPEAFSCDEEGFEETSSYIKEVIRDNVDLIEDESYDKFAVLQPGEWKRMSVKDRAAVFYDWILYYNPSEFETFIKDIGYLRFMTAYDLTEPAYMSGKECPDLERDLKEIWDTVQAEPW